MDPMGCIRSFGWTLSELLPETSWNYDTVRDLNQGRMRWQASWTLQNSEPETFAAVFAYKRAKQVTTQLLPKASSLIKQERSWMLRWQVLWLTSLPALLVHPSEIWVFQPQITTPAAHHCKPWSLHVATNQLEDGQDSSCPHVLSDTVHRPIGPESMMCKVLSRQRVFMNQLLGHRTRVTLRLSPRADQNLNL